MEIKTLEVDDSEIFLPEESRLIKKTIDIREQVVDEIMRHGVPTKTSELRVLNEYLNSIDDVVLNKVDRRLKHTETKDNSKVLEMVKARLLEGEKLKQNLNIEKTGIELDSNYQLDDLTPGEDKVEYEEITLEEIRGEG